MVALLADRVMLDADGPSQERGVRMPGIGPWLQRELDRREWRQVDLARRINGSTGMVSQWITGARMPSPESCDRLADVLGADLDHILALAGHRPAALLYEPDAERAAIIAAVRRVDLTPERVAVLRALLDVWARHPVER